MPGLFSTSEAPCGQSGAAFPPEPDLRNKSGGDSKFYWNKNHPQRPFP